MEFSGPVMTKERLVVFQQIFMLCANLIVHTYFYTINATPIWRWLYCRACCERDTTPPLCTTTDVYRDRVGMGSDMFHHKDCSEGRISYILLIGHPVGSM